MSAYNVYHSALFQHHNEHERWPAFQEVQTELVNAEFWMMFRELIEASTILFPHQETIRRLLTAERINDVSRMAAFLPDDKEWLKRMIRRGKMIKVYRGGAQANMTGLAWTTSNDAALQHALRSGAKKPTITVAYMQPRHAILANYDDRTIITLPEEIKIDHVQEVPSHVSHDYAASRTLQVAVAWKGANAPMNCTPVEYFQHAIDEGRATKESIVTQLTTSRKFLENLGFKARIARIDEVIGGL